jgi:putative hydrolase
MKLTFDLHTHTTFSHGKGTIEENVQAGIKVGLSTIGISDHGPGHVTYGIKRNNILLMREEIERLKPLYPEIKILLGMEANIINLSGKTDLILKDIMLLDYVNAGYHYGVFGDNPLLSTRIHAGNLLRQFTNKSSRKLKKINTELALRAIYENKITVLTHPGFKEESDLLEIAKACAERGTYMEISDGHNFLSVEDIKKVSNSQVKFVIQSDAHTPDKVGSFRNGYERAREAGLDLARIVNLEV